MKNNPASSKSKWFSIEQKLAYARPETVLEWMTQSFVTLVDVVLNGDQYNDLKHMDINELRFKHVKEINQEYRDCVQKLTAMIEAERSESNETTPINSVRQENCETIGGYEQNTGLAL